MKLLLPLLAMLLLGACAHRASHFDAPDASKLQASARKLSSAVIASRDAVKEASTAVKTAKANHDAESVRIAEIEPKVLSLLRVTPMELRPFVDAIEADVIALHGEHDTTAHSIDAALVAQGVATAKLEEANAAKNEVEKLSPGFLAEVARLTERANRAEQAWAKDSKELVGMKLHRLMGWIIMVAGIALCALWGFAKIATRGAAVAAKF